MLRDGVARSERLNLAAGVGRPLSAFEIADNGAQQNGGG
jgi:hypothetical protein